jgi:hypothetical protein
MGPIGPAGPQGFPGVSGYHIYTAEYTYQAQGSGLAAVAVSPGKGRWGGADVISGGDVVLAGSFPTTDPQFAPGWNFRVKNVGTGPAIAIVRAYVVCAVVQ